jgi:hypothetical protein
VHRTSVDIYVIADVTKQFVTYVSTDTYGHNRVVNWAQKVLTKALGSVVWQESGLANRRARAVALTRDVDYRIDNGMIVGFFAQGEYQPDSVETIEPGLFGLLQRYSSRTAKPFRFGKEVTVVPVGLSYDCRGKGLAQSRFADFLSKYVPLFPHWSAPARNTHVTVSFGEPHQFGGEDVGDFTARIMIEAARLSDIPYNVSAVPEADAEPTDSNAT